MKYAHIIDRILFGDGWFTQRDIFEEFKLWRFYETYLEGMKRLKRDRLYASRIHGESHIERVMLLGALGAMAGGIDRRETEMLLDACAYHDVGRVNDSYDIYHGERSAAVIGEITGREESYDLTVIMCAVHAHSRPDEDMAGVMELYGLKGDEYACSFCCMLKDADNMDRFRINDFDEKFLRMDYNHRFVSLAKEMAQIWYPKLEAEAQE